MRKNKTKQEEINNKKIKKNDRLEKRARRTIQAP